MSLPNELIARRWFEEVWNQRNLATIHDLLPSHGVCHAEEGFLIGPEEFLKEVYEPFLLAFPDLQFAVEGTITTEDQIVVRWTAFGNHKGGSLGIPPTYLDVIFHGLTWMRIREGRIEEARDHWNRNGLLQALQGGPIPLSMTLKETVRSRAIRRADEAAKASLLRLAIRRHARDFDSSSPSGE